MAAVCKPTHTGASSLPLPSKVGAKPMQAIPPLSFKGLTPPPAAQSAKHSIKYNPLEGQKTAVTSAVATNAGIIKTAKGEEGKLPFVKPVLKAAAAPRKKAKYPVWILDTPWGVQPVVAKAPPQFTLQTFVYQHFLRYLQCDVERVALTKEDLFAKEVTRPHHIKVTFCQEGSKKEVLLVKCKRENGARAFIEMGEEEPGHFYVLTHVICLRKGKYAVQPLCAKVLFNTREVAYLNDPEFLELQRVFKGKHPLYSVFLK